MGRNIDERMTIKKIMIRIYSASIPISDPRVPAPISDLFFKILIDFIKNLLDVKNTIKIKTLCQFHFLYLIKIYLNVIFRLIYSRI